MISTSNVCSILEMLDNGTVSAGPPGLDADVENPKSGPTSLREAPTVDAGTRRSDDVKYMLLIYNNPAFLATMAEDERNAVFIDVDAVMRELTESGELVGGEALADVSQTKTVRVRDGLPVITDGPFVEAKEHLAGYLMVDCESPERAVEIAARWPDARYWAMEVRPVMDVAGEVM